MTLKPSMSGQQSGFTLLEMLVALVVLGFLMVGLTQGVRAGLTMWGAQARRVGETADLDAGARVLRRLLSGISLLSAGGIVLGASSTAEVRSSPGQSNVCWRSADRVRHNPSRRHHARASRGTARAALDPASPRAIHRAASRAH